MRLPDRSILAVAALCIGCSDLDNIDIEAGGQTTVPAGTVVDQLLGDLQFLGFEGFDISESQEFANAGYSKSQIDSVRLTRLSLSIASPETGNFDFLERVAFFAESEGLARIEIARLDPVPPGSNVLELELSDVDLRDYAAAESMTITTEATGVRPDTETAVDALAILDVDVNISGACD
jgi:hypothetical protein